MIPTIESRASNIPMDKWNYVCCHNDSTDKDHHKICRSQYGHPGSAIGYWLEMCLGHVYIVLEPVGSTRLTFDDDLYYELCALVTEVCREYLSDFGFRQPLGTPVNARTHSKPIRCPNIAFQYIDLYVSTISRLLVMSVITSGTPNKLRYIKIYKLIMKLSS